MLYPVPLRDMVSQSVQKFGVVDVLINNAGIQHGSSIEEFPEETWDDILRFNLTVAFHLTKGFWPRMKEKGFGRIINISSLHGLFASVLKSSYVAAKHGLVGLTKTTALEGVACGITSMQSALRM